MSESIIYQKSYSALEVIQLYKQLNLDIKEVVLSKQLLRPGTSISANVKEAVSAASRGN